MKRIVLLFFVLFNMNFVLADEILTFATWNMRYANAKDSAAGNGWTKRVKPIARSILFHDFEVVNLQEMDENDSVPMVEMLLKNLSDYKAVSCGDSACKDFNPILYKASVLKLIGHGIFWFAPKADSASKGWDAMYRRYCTWAEFEKNGKYFFVFNAHWDHKGIEARKESAKMSVSMVRQVANGNPAIYAGDLNCERKYDCIRLMHDSYWNDARDVADGVFLQDSSYNHFKMELGKKTLDHIFVTRKIHVESFAIVRELYYDGTEWRHASDHNPVMIRAVIR